MQRSVALALLTASTALLSACTRQAETRGRQLFEGELPLPAQIEGHKLILPVEASRCSNCHTVSAGASATLTSVQTLGGPLSQRRLTGTQSRRGGPATRFDKASFCRLLQTGIDPANIVVTAAMPRYLADPPDCDALWVFLTQD